MDADITPYDELTGTDVADMIPASSLSRLERQLTGKPKAKTASYKHDFTSTSHYNPN